MFLHSKKKKMKQDSCLTGEPPAPISFQSLRLLCGEPQREKWKKREESSWILSSLLHTHTHTFCARGLVIGVAMTTHTIQLLCVSVDSVGVNTLLLLLLIHTLIKKKKKINPGSGDRALALTIGWIISKQRMRSFETWDSSTCCLQQLAPSIEKWSPFVSQTTNLPSGTWPHCLPQTLPWLSLSFLFFTRPLH